MKTLREQRLADEMNPETNPLIPGGKAAREVEREAIASDTGHAADERRLQSPKFNALIPGSAVKGYRSASDAPAGIDVTWSESLGLWVPAKP